MRNTRKQKLTAKQFRAYVGDVRSLVDRMEMLGKNVPRNGRVLYAVKSLDVAVDRLRAFVEANEQKLETNGKK